ncbi:RNA polymerase sigma factor [Parabacteroides sp. ZJ-118]|uniref:RNA polymerase sigma factor n=1 Tax=Parabacteroides sp. ZJ-118 TaxID=2709398 RepID=UPI00197FDECA|nr:RNA polymerase sigma factor [Parabacteroides sp. ZJ-118]
MICFSSFVVLIIEMELETFKKTVLPLRQKMLKFSRRLVEDTAEAEDVVQEAFIKLWYIREKLDAYQSVEALAMQVTKNLSLDKIKSRKPQGSELESVTLVSDVVSPDERLEQRDAVECIRRLIAQLPTLQQTIIRMKDVEGYELAEIAEITATPVENVRVNLSRARKKIREQFLQLNKQEKWT